MLGWLRGHVHLWSVLGIILTLLLLLLLLLLHHLMLREGRLSGHQHDQRREGDAAED